MVLSWIGRFRLGLFLSTLFPGFICGRGIRPQCLKSHHRKFVVIKSDFQEFFSFLFLSRVVIGVLQMWVRPKHFVEDCRFFMLQKPARCLSCEKPLSVLSSHERVFSYPPLISNIINKWIWSNPYSTISERSTYLPTYFASSRSVTHKA